MLGEMFASVSLEQRHVDGFEVLLEVRMRDIRLAGSENEDIIRHCKYLMSQVLNVKDGWPWRMRFLNPVRGLT